MAEQPPVGRAEEIGLLSTFLDAGDCGPRRMMALWGMSGLGKSSLIDETSRIAAGRGYRTKTLALDEVIEGINDSAGIFEILVDEIARFFAGSQRNSARSAFNKFSAARDKAASRLADAHGAVSVKQRASRGSSIGDVSITVDTPNAVGIAAQFQYRRALIDALVRIVERSPSEPLLLLIDAGEMLQWLDEPEAADGESARTPSRRFVQELFGGLVDVVPDLRVIIAGREEVPISPEFLYGSIRLTPWTPEQSAQFFAARGLDDGDLVRMLQRLCHGIPVWAQMSTDLLLEPGAAGSRTAADWLESEVNDAPSGEWLTHRFLRKIPVRQRSVLRAAAVLRSVTEESLVCLLEGDAENLPADWYVRLRGYSFMQAARDVERDRPRYRMHPLVRQAILAELDRERPSYLDEMHRRAAAYYSGLGDVNAEAYHRFAADDFDSEEADRAVSYWFDALDEAIRSGRTDEALRLIDVVQAPEQARRLSRRRPVLYAWSEYRAGEVAAVQDRLADAERFLAAAAEKLQDWPVAEVYGRVMHRRSMVARRLRDIESADRFAAESYSVLQGIGSVAAADVILLMSDNALIATNYLHAQRTASVALTLYLRYGNELGVANCFKALGHHARFINWEADAEQFYLTALDIYRQVNDLTGEANVLRILGEMALAADDLESAEDLGGRALEIFERLDSRLGIATVWQLLGATRSAVGDLDSAGDLLGRSLRLLRRYRRLGGTDGRAVLVGQVGSGAVGPPRLGSPSATSPRHGRRSAPPGRSRQGPLPTRFYSGRAREPRRGSRHVHRGGRLLRVEGRSPQ